MSSAALFGALLKILHHCIFEIAGQAHAGHTIYEQPFPRTTHSQEQFAVRIQRTAPTATPSVGRGLRSLASNRIGHATVPAALHGGAAMFLPLHPRTVGNNSSSLWMWYFQHFLPT